MNRKLSKGFTLIEILIVVVIIGLLTFMAVPAYNKVKQNAKNKEIVNNLKTIAAAGTQYILESEATQAPYNKLEGAYFSPITPIAGEDYTNLTVLGEGGTLTVTKGDGTTVTFNY